MSQARIEADTWEHQRRTFERTAAEYDRYRPTYPEVLFEEIRAYADLAPDDRILEVGCGTGRATVYLAAWGNQLLAIEPAEAMAAITRKKLAGRSHIEVRTARFEDDVHEHNAFGLVACAQAYHWLDPDTRVERIGDALYNYGTAAIIANVPVVPNEGDAFHVRVQHVYQEFAPDLVHKGEVRTPDTLPPHPFEGSPLFVDLVQRKYPWHWTLDTREYIGLLQTHSPHAALGPDVRTRLVDGIAELIDAEFGGAVTEYYVAMAALGRRA